MPTAKEAITERAVSVRKMAGNVVKADKVTVKEVITVRAVSVRTTVVTVAKAVTVTVKEAIATIMVAVSVVRKAAMGTTVSVEAGCSSAVPVITTPMPNIA